MNPKVDLSLLATPREPRPGRRPGYQHHRIVLTRFVLPGTLLLGFSALVLFAVQDSLSPPRAVTVIPVITQQGSMVPENTPLFRAAGWIEPRPTPIVVTALAEGVVDRLLVIEGQEVQKGQLLAQLIDADAKLAVASADADVELREGELASAQATMHAARERLEHPVHLEAERAEAESALARAESELAGLPSLISAAESRRAFAKRDFDGARRSGTAVSSIAVDKARSELDALAGTLNELQTRQKRLPVEIAALKAKRDAQREKLSRKIDEHRQFREATAAVRSAMARLQQAKVSRDVAQLRLERMEIRSPITGRVLALVARPGSRLNGLTTNSLQDSSTVLTLYDPSRLQIRVDVRLEDVAKVRSGQKAQIETAALGNTKLEGQVLLATSQADIQKNTLSIKVAIDNPMPTLKPEMLCQVTFLAPPTIKEDRSVVIDRMLVPRQLLESGGLWVVDPVSETARLRSVEVGAAFGELVEIVRGLASSDKVIVSGRDGLKEGTRVRVVGEDDTLGIASTTKSGKER